MRKIASIKWGLLSSVITFIFFSIIIAGCNKEYQKNRKVSSFKLLYTQGVWKDSENAKLNDRVGDLLNTGTLSLGYIGLAETLVLLNGKHHGESEESQKLGVEIVKFIREEMDKKTEEHKLNFSVIATPAEGYAGKSVRKFKQKYGVIETEFHDGF